MNDAQIGAEKIYDAALEKWGRKSQEEMLVEECAELIVAIKKLDRDASNSTIEAQLKTYNNFIGELADVQIMLEQVIRAHKVEKMVDAKKRSKLERLARRLKSC